MQFVNRIQELAFLERMFGRDSSQFLVLWGRRRVGKTRLIQEFSRQKRLLYFVGTQSTERLSVQAWSAQAADFFADPQHARARAFLANML